MDMVMTTPVEAILGIAMLILVMITFVGCGSSIFSGENAKEEAAIKSFQQLVYSVKLLAFGDETVEYEYLQSAFAFKDYNIYAFNKYFDPASHVQAPSPGFAPSECHNESCLCLYKGDYKKGEPNKNLLQCEIIFVPDKLVNFAPGELDLNYKNDIQYNFLFAKEEENLKNFFIIAHRKEESKLFVPKYTGGTINYDVLIGLYYFDPVESNEFCSESNNAPCGTKGFNPYFSTDLSIFKIDICKGTVCGKGTCSWSGNSATCLT